MEAGERGLDPRKKKNSKPKVPEGHFSKKKWKTSLQNTHVGTKSLHDLLKKEEVLCLKNV